jgi:hypothetical protein
MCIRTDVGMCVAAGYHPSWGNYGSDSGEECGIPTFYRFQTPKNGNNVFWYRYGARTERGVGV